MRISDWSSDVCSSDLSASPEPATPEMADDELNLEAEHIMQPAAEAVAELTPTPVEEPVQQARITQLRSEPAAKAPPTDRDRIDQPSARPANTAADPASPLNLFAPKLNLSSGAP